MNRLLKLPWGVLTLAAVSLVIGCASDSQSKTGGSIPYKDRQYAANPSKVKFGEFKAVELMETQLATEQDDKPETAQARQPAGQTDLGPGHSNDHSVHKANEASAKKIDAMLLAGLKNIWPSVKFIPTNNELPESAERTLQIIPTITHINLVSVAARVWVGAMAGGSDIVMHVDYRDSATGELIANPDFWKGNNAWSGGNSWGETDNQIRDAVVNQILFYTIANK